MNAQSVYGFFFCIYKLYTLFLSCCYLVVCVSCLMCRFFNTMRLGFIINVFLYIAILHRIHCFI